MPDWIRKLRVPVVLLAMIVTIWCAASAKNSQTRSERAQYLPAPDARDKVATLLD